MPIVSVIMSVLNGERYLHQAVDSILTQTLRNFELVIVNDGSTDASQQILEGYSDTRVRVFYQAKRGVGIALNRAIGLSSGRFVARMDADDICLPERLERQAAFLDAQPKVGIVGTTYEIVDEREQPKCLVPVLCRDDWMRKELLFGSPFCHGAVMIRRELLEVAGGYDPAVMRAEDHDLWLRLAARSRLANLPQVLYKYRVHSMAVSLRESDMHRRYARSIADSALERKLADASYLQSAPAELPFNQDSDPYRRARERTYANICFRLGNAYSLHGRQRDARHEFGLAVRYAPERWDYSIGWASSFLPIAVMPELRRFRKLLKINLPTG